MIKFIRYMYVNDRAIALWLSDNRRDGSRLPVWTMRNLWSQMSGCDALEVVFHPSNNGSFVADVRRGCLGASGGSGLVRCPDIDHNESSSWLKDGF